MTPRVRPVLAGLLSMALVLQGAAPALAAPQGQEGKANAADLAKAADRAVGFTVKAAGESGDAKLKQENKDSEPFWQALKRLNDAVEKTQRGLTLKDDSFHANLALATSAVEEMKITYGMSGATDPAVKEGIEKVDAAVSLLRENYSREALRLKQGGALTPEEGQKLDEIKAKQGELQKKLKEVGEKVGDNKTLLKGVKEMQKKSQEVSRCNHDLSGFIFASAAISILNGWVWGWHWWWGPWGFWGPGFIGGFYDIYVDVWVDVPYDWDYLDDYYVDTADLDLGVDISDAELETMDQQLDEGDFDVTQAEAEDFSQDELAYEGEMDIVDQYEFEDPGMGDWGTGAEDMGFDDVGFDDMGGFDFD